MEKKAFKEEKEMLLERLKKCDLCFLNCKVDRTKNKSGFCGVGKSSNVFNCTIFFDGINKIFPSYGIFFAGCDLSCSFCPFYDENKSSKNFKKVNNYLINKINEEIRTKKPKSISFLGGEGTVHLYEILRIIENLEKKLPLIIYTNLYFENSLSEILKKYFKYIIADFHFGSDLCAFKISKAKNYFEVAKKNVLSLKSKIILRHLLLPGHIHCCFKKIADFLKNCAPDLEIILIPQYFPFFGIYSQSKPLRFLDKEELEEALNYAKRLKIKAKIYENFYENKINLKSFSNYQEIIIDEKGKIAFKYPDGFALNLKKTFEKGVCLGHKK